LRLRGVLVALLALVFAPAASAGVKMQQQVVPAKPGGFSVGATVIVRLRTAGPPVQEMHLEIAAQHPWTLAWLTTQAHDGIALSRPVFTDLGIGVHVPPGSRYGTYRFTARVVADGTSIGVTHFVIKVGDALDTPTVRAAWRGRSFAGGIALRGFVPAAGKLTVAIRAPGESSSDEHTYVLMPAAYSAFIRLGANAIPGMYSVTETVALDPADSNSVPDYSQKWTVRLAGPAMGYVDRAWISQVEDGPPAQALAAGTRALFANFHLASPPRAGRATTTWYQPDGTSTPSVAKHANAFIRGFVHSSAALPAGLWRCVLRVSGVEIGQAEVRVG
jgi:hypothetical protein